jgi:hypothetical protein
MTSGGLTLEDLVAFDWEMALGEERLPLVERETLARLKAPLVRLRGQWVQRSTEEIQAAFEFWKKKAIGQSTMQAVIQLALGAVQAPGGFTFEGVNVYDWMSGLLVQLNGDAVFEKLPTQEDFVGTLRSYQVRGYSWLACIRRWGLDAFLAG